MKKEIIEIVHATPGQWYTRAAVSRFYYHYGVGVNETTHCDPAILEVKAPD